MADCQDGGVVWFAIHKGQPLMSSSRDTEYCKETWKAALIEVKHLGTGCQMRGSCVDIQDLLSLITDGDQGTSTHSTYILML